MPRFKPVISSVVKKTVPVLTGEEYHDVMIAKTSLIISTLNTTVYNAIVRTIDMNPEELDTLIKITKRSKNSNALVQIILKESYDECTHILYDNASELNTYCLSKKTAENYFNITDIVPMTVPSIENKYLLLKQIYAAQRDFVNRIMKLQLLPYWQTCDNDIKKMIGVVHIWNILKVIKKIILYGLAALNNESKSETCIEKNSVKNWTIKYVVYELFYNVMFPELKCVDMAIYNELNNIRTDCHDNFSSNIQFKYYHYASKIFTKYYTRIHRCRHLFAKEDIVYTEFEKNYLQQIKEFYAIKTTEWSSKLNVTEYVNHVIRSHEVENVIIRNLLKLRDATEEDWSKIAKQFEINLFGKAIGEHFSNGRKPDGSISRGIKLIKNYICYRGDYYSDWIKALNVLSYELSLPLEHVFGNVKLPINTIVRYHETVDKIFVVEHQEFLYNHETSGLKAMFEKEDKATIHKIQQICVYLPDSVKIISECYQQYLTAKLMHVINGLSIGESLVVQDYIGNLVLIHAKSDDFIKCVFDGGPEYKKVHSETFTKCLSAVIDGAKTSNAELFATYLDQLLQGAKGYAASDEEKIHNIETVIALMKFLSDKDIFGESYRMLLAKRLVNQKVSSMDLERATIIAMKLANGVSFVSKMEIMIKDYMFDGIKPADFHRYAEVVNHLSKLDFNVQVLTSSAWPSFPNFTMKYGGIAAYYEAFTQFYRTLNDKRVLQFIPSIGNITITAAFGGRKYELVVIPPQAVIIDLFNYRASYTVEEICTITTIPMKIVCGMIDSFMRIGMLGKSTTDKGFKPEDLIMLNEKFTSKTLKTVVRAPNISESKTVVAISDIVEQRKLVTEATIVRIMKARKTLDHAQLVGEVLHQIHLFTPEPKQIKACIEGLISRDYLERGDDACVYNYLA